MLRLCACAALEASGRLDELRPAIGKALDCGVTVGELSIVAQRQRK